MEIISLCLLSAEIPRVSSHGTQVVMVTQEALYRLSHLQAPQQYFLSCVQGLWGRNQKHSRLQSCPLLAGETGLL